jgi:hypothetical protein
MPRGPNYPWPQIIRQLRAQPGRWLLHHTMVGRPASVAAHVQERRAAPLRAITDGRITTHSANRSTNDEGQEIVDLYLKFIPKEGA